MAHAAAPARPGRIAFPAQRRRATLRRAGAGGVVRRARDTRSTHEVAARRGRPRAFERRSRQDLGDARHTPPAETAGRRFVPLAHRLGPVVGAAELAALFRCEHEADRGAPASGTGGARRQRPDEGRADRRDRRPPRAEACRRTAPLRVGNALEAARMARRPLLRPEPRQSRDLHAPGGRELTMGRDPRSRRGGADSHDRLLPRLRADDRRRVRELAGGRLVREASAPCVVRRARRPGGRSRRRRRAQARAGRRPR